MTQTTHTQAPWSMILAPLQVVTDSSIICTIEPSNPDKYANARLIAAAPELLNVLELIMSSKNAWPDGALDKAISAIAKARGQL